MNARIQFKGRKHGAIGVFYWIQMSVDIPDVNPAALVTAIHGSGYELGSGVVVQLPRTTHWVDCATYMEAISHA